MPKIPYEKWAPRREAILIIREANTILADLAEQGYDVTLRQLYYQFVSRDLIPNTQASYNKLGTIINNARMAGWIDWEHLVDRTRNLKSISHFETPGEIISAAANQFRLDKWSDQPTRVEVWVEKEALAGVIQRVAERNDAAWFSCRGYVSQSEMWGAARRIGEYILTGQNVIILHLGDHDPSGVDMTRDIKERIGKFLAVDFGYIDPDDDYDEFDVEVAIDTMSEEHTEERPAFEVNRIALNFDQVQQYNPPPNPAKITDSRADKYIQRYGRESWELDALNPATLDALINTHLDAVIETGPWNARVAQEIGHRDTMKAAAQRWNLVEELLSEEEE